MPPRMTARHRAEAAPSRPQALVTEITEIWSTIATRLAHASRHDVDAFITVLADNFAQQGPQMPYQVAYGIGLRQALTVMPKGGRSARRPVTGRRVRHGGKLPDTSRL